MSPEEVFAIEHVAKYHRVRLWPRPVREATSLPGYNDAGSATQQHTLNRNVIENCALSLVL